VYLVLNSSTKIHIRLKRRIRREELIKNKKKRSRREEYFNTFHNTEPKSSSYRKRWPVKGLYKAENQLRVHPPQMLTLVIKKNKDNEKFENICN
jgi:hypothetical protein